MTGENYFVPLFLNSDDFYSSIIMESEGDYYVIKGDFEMLGKKQKVDVQIKYIGENDEGIPVLIGKSSIDRTLFGMQPDPKEGNLVDFTLAVLLKKK